MSGGLLGKLNPAQREAASVVEGPVLVLAGAGTGKTRVITFRIAHMIQSGVKPDNILGMTFTNKAAREMKERVGALLSPSVAAKVTLGTFHSFCARILRWEVKRLGYLPNFTITDESDMRGLVRQAEAELGYRKEDASVEEVLSYIGRKKNRLLTPSQCIRTAETDFEVKASHIYERYQQMLENQNMLDFDDLLMFVCQLWEKDPAILKKYQEHYQYILVDEYQDTNFAQFTLLKTLAGEKMNLCVVGDDDQSIYGWRGAEVSHILQFQYHFPGAKVVKLEQNYRSTNKILKSANTVINHNEGRYQKNLWSEQGDGDNLKVVRVDNDEAEADFLGSAIKSVMRENSSRSFRDFAILYRSNYLSRQIEQSLRRAEIPYRLVGSTSFYSRKEIKDAVAYLRVLHNPKDDQSLLRILSVPPRGIGDKAIARMKELQANNFKSFVELLGDEAFLSELGGHAREGALSLHRSLGRNRAKFDEPGRLAEKIHDFLLEVGYLNGLQAVYKDLKESEKRQENVMEFVNSAAQFETKYPDHATMSDFLESQALLDDNDRTEEDKENSDAVTLTTVHAAKGLEFPYVFIVGAEHNLFPHERAVQEGSIDEELRLFYVALTRAKSNIVISHADKRFHRGKPSRQRPSNFLRLLPEDMTETMKAADFAKPLDKKELEDAFASIFDILDDK